MIYLAEYINTDDAITNPHHKNRWQQEAMMFARPTLPVLRLWQRLMSRPAPERPSLLARALYRLAVQRQRRRLRDLDDYLLRDIGLSRDEALTEAQRALWDPPGHWRL